MAREFQDIKNEITDYFINDSDVIEKYSLTTGQTFEQQFSKVSVENILFNVFAFGLWIFEKLIDQNKKEIDEQIANSRIHTRKWYREKALAYMHGYELNDSDQYDVSELTDAQISSAKIIANAAPLKMQGYLRIKVVKMVANNLAPLTPTELQAFGQYMNYVTDAGTFVKATSSSADDLKLSLKIYYNPMILGADGSRLDGTASTPVKDAINGYLKSLRFNGAFVESKLEDELQKVEGVQMVKIVGAWSKFGSYAYTDTLNPNVGPIDEVRVADAGYMKFDDNNSSINYVAYTDYD